MSTLPMAETQPTAETTAVASSPQASFAICLPSMPSDALSTTIERLKQNLPGESLLVASPDQTEEHTLHDGAVRLVPYPSQRSGGEWVLSAADYLAAARLADERSLSGVVFLGADATTLNPAAIAELRKMLESGVDLAVPRYHVGAGEALVNSAMLYPLTRALFGVDTRFPLPLDAAMSRRMLTRLSGIITRMSGALEDALVWPVAEASISGFSVRQLEGVERALPRPQQADLNILLPTVCSSLFADVEAKATYWQRARTLPAGRPQVRSANTPDSSHIEEVRALAEDFRLAFSNLREIWSLVVPPQSLLALKKLSLTPAENFTFPPTLWARVVYDFALGFHMRTLNRGHLLGSMTPLYLAWVASLLRENSVPATGTGQLELTAAAFEQEKPYLVSRWRWPDRFNP